LLANDEKIRRKASVSSFHWLGSATVTVDKFLAWTEPRLWMASSHLHHCINYGPTDGASADHDTGTTRLNSHSKRHFCCLPKMRLPGSVYSV